MTKIKITSNPYQQTISYQHFNEEADTWDNIIDIDPNTKLRYDKTSKKIFLPFKIKDIVDTIIDEYWDGQNKIEILFAGTDDEYNELRVVCEREGIGNKITLEKGEIHLADASSIIDGIKNIFNEIRPIVEERLGDDKIATRDDLSKIDEALANNIPVCVFGNYSTGKSTFINAMIGHEVLPKAAEPVTAKIYKITRSSDETAQIAFVFQASRYKIHFDENAYSIFEGSTSSPIAQKINDVFERCATEMYNALCETLEVINSYDKEHGSNDVGDVIEINVPFSRNGILGISDHNFVIFDTPGENSDTHKDHAEILEAALKSLSNGIPVWMTRYDNLDSIDNARLCDKILNIEALDKRFTMIVVNRADDAQLNHITDKVSEIMGFNSVEKMYSNGIYFLCSIMGLGAKIGGEFNDDHYDRIYGMNHAFYSDPKNKHYMTLYKYNIMPEQIKDKIIHETEACNDRVYANSGLFCIEKAMDDFASRYAAYNKCEMVSLFIEKVVGKVKEIISDRVESLEKQRSELTGKLESEKNQLLEEIRQKTDDLDADLHKKSENEAEKSIERHTAFYLTAQEFDRRERKFITESDRHDIDEHKQTVAGKKESAKDNLLQGGKEFIHFRFANGIDHFKKCFVNLGQMITAAKVVGSKENQEDQNVSEKLIEFARDKYNKSITTLYDDLTTYLDRLWRSYIEEFRTALENLISGSAALNYDQRRKLTELVVDFDLEDLVNASNEVFLRERLRNGYFLGLPLDALDSDLIKFLCEGAELLDKEKLANEYNGKLKASVDEMAHKINQSCYEGFQSWKHQLVATIERNITEFNPLLAAIAADIHRKNVEINDLCKDRNTLANAISTIQTMMSWA